MVERICDADSIDSTHSIINLLQRSKIKLRFGDTRETHATFMTKHLQQPEIDFLQGRVATNVFMRNYFNLALVGDLKERAFQGIQRM